MKRISAFALAWLVLFPAAAFAQTRPRTTKRTTTPTTTKRSTRPTKSGTAKSRTAADQARTHGATRIAEQIKLLTRFVYLLGGVVKGIEAADEAARRNETSPAVITQTENSKATIRKSLQDWRDALDRLELDFRTTPELERYYPELAGVAQAAATAEEQGARNQFDQAGRTLLKIVNQLTDVLLVMR